MLNRGVLPAASGASANEVTLTAGGSVAGKSPAQPVSTKASNTVPIAVARILVVVMTVIPGWRRLGEELTRIDGQWRCFVAASPGSKKLRL